MISSLSQLFGAFGEVVESSVVIDRSTNQSKGFGFVQMANDEEARNAIAGLNGTMLGNRTIRVNEAQPRPERTGGPRGGYSSGSDRWWLVTAVVTIVAIVTVAAGRRPPPP